MSQQSSSSGVVNWSQRDCDSSDWWRMYHLKRLLMPHYVSSKQSLEDPQDCCSLLLLSLQDLTRITAQGGKFAGINNIVYNLSFLIQHFGCEQFPGRGLLTDRTVVFQGTRVDWVLEEMGGMKLGRTLQNTSSSTWCWRRWKILEVFSFQQLPGVCTAVSMDLKHSWIKMKLGPRSCQQWNTSEAGLIFSLNVLQMPPCCALTPARTQNLIAGRASCAQESFAEWLQSPPLPEPICIQNPWPSRSGRCVPGTSCSAGLNSCSSCEAQFTVSQCPLQCLAFFVLK